MKHVLVVEDDPHNAVVFRKILEKRAGCRVTVTDSAVPPTSNAISTCNRSPIASVIPDRTVFLNPCCSTVTR